MKYAEGKRGRGERESKERGKRQREGERGRERGSQKETEGDAIKMRLLRDRSRAAKIP